MNRVQRSIFYLTASVVVSYALFKVAESGGNELHEVITMTSPISNLKGSCILVKLATLPILSPTSKPTSRLQYLTAHV